MSLAPTCARPTGSRHILKRVSVFAFQGFLLLCDGSFYGGHILRKLKRASGVLRTRLALRKADETAQSTVNDIRLSYQIFP